MSAARNEQAKYTRKSSENMIYLGIPLQGMLILAIADLLVSQRCPLYCLGLESENPGALEYSIYAKYQEPCGCVHWLGIELFESQWYLGDAHQEKMMNAQNDHQNRLIPWYPI